MDKNNNILQTRCWVVQNKQHFLWDSDGKVISGGNLIVDYISLALVVPIVILRLFAFPLIVICVFFFVFPNHVAEWLIYGYITIQFISIIAFLISAFVIKFSFEDQLLQPELFDAGLEKYLKNSLSKDSSFDKAKKMILKRARVGSGYNMGKNFMKLSLSIVLTVQSIIIYRGLPWGVELVSFNFLMAEMWKIISYEIILFIDTISLGLSRHLIGNYLPISDNLFDIVSFEIIRIFLVFAAINEAIESYKNILQKPVILVKDNIFGLRQFLRNHRLGEKGVMGCEDIVIYDAGKPAESNWKTTTPLTIDDINEIEMNAVTYILSGSDFQNNIVGNEKES